MVDYLIEGGTVVTQNADREWIRDGAVAIEDGTIRAVGSTSRLRQDVGTDETVDASGHLVLPGFVDPHVHVSDILLRGYTGEDRGLFDWIHNVKSPGVAAMSVEDHRIAAALFCCEALRSGVTTFVENDLDPVWSTETAEAKLDTYHDAGVRTVYGRGIVDRAPTGEFARLKRDKERREPDVEHVPITDPPSLDAQLESTASLIDAVGDVERQSVWPAPGIVEGLSPEALQRSLALAEEYDVMTTTHVSESRLQENRTTSIVEYLGDVGYLSERTLLGHCVHASERDVRLLAESGTRVSHNLLTNLRLGSGIAPLRELRARGVPVGIGTDNATLNDTVDPLTDARYAALVHKGYNEDPGSVTAQDALDMITIEAARTIGRADELGSIETGKRADLVLVDTDSPHLTPSPNPIDAVVYGANGSDVDTVFCEGKRVVDDGAVRTLASSHPDLLDAATDAAADLVERTGIETTRDD
jgi:cytosine/adenosine deaminase-related metal-dependent hydrolase